MSRCSQGHRRSRPRIRRPRAAIYGLPVSARNCRCTKGFAGVLSGERGADYSQLGIPQPNLHRTKFGEPFLRASQPKQGCYALANVRAAQRSLSLTRFLRASQPRKLLCRFSPHQTKSACWGPLTCENVRVGLRTLSLTRLPGRLRPITTKCLAIARPFRSAVSH